MATHKSAIKTMRRSQERRKRNRHHRSRLRSQVKRIRRAIEAGDKDTAASLLSPTLSMLDRTAKLGALHHNAAARAKSRITRDFNKLSG